MYFVKEGKNEWVKIKCICVLIIFISGINCKYICLYDLVINYKKKVKKKNWNLYIGFIMIISRYFLLIIYFCSFILCCGVGEMYVLNDIFYL